MERRAKKPKQPKKVSYEILAPESFHGHAMYALLNDLVAAHHPELERARIALGWCTAWEPDVDGRVTLGKCKKASDLDRELAAYDFVILLRRSFWLDPRVTEAQQTALLDHELHHAALKYDEKGDPVVDERGRLVYRVRKHDIEEFTAIVERYGTWTVDLERFAYALRRSGSTYAPCDQCREMPGWVTVVDGAGNHRVTRCACFVTWREQRALQEAG